eukprot:15151054-Heterocapsa_arctica.AAC.1
MMDKTQDAGGKCRNLAGALIAQILREPLPQDPCEQIFVKSLGKGSAEWGGHNTSRIISVLPMIFATPFLLVACFMTGGMRWLPPLSSY